VVESHFEHCTIQLGLGTELVVGEPGLLLGCQVSGPGRLTVHGQLFEDASSPAVRGARSLVVSQKGIVRATIEQHPKGTIFAIEPGARLSVRITTSTAEA
jgi:hypothetical protein